MMENTIVITPLNNPFQLNLKELWLYRELVLILAWRNIKLRYKQTFLGIVWVILQPTIITLIFATLFGKIAKIPSEGMPYELFVYSGIIFWTFFSNSISSVTNSVVSMGGVIQKVYFPRLIIPFSAVITSVVDLTVSLIPLVALSLYFGIPITIGALIFIPVGVVGVTLSSMGLGMILSSLNVRFRDIRMVLPFLLQIGLFLTPVIYPLSVIYDYRRLLLILNPLTGIIEVFRSLIIGGNVEWHLLGISMFESLVIFIVGLIYFQKTQQKFADVI